MKQVSAIGKCLFAAVPFTLACLVGTGCRSNPPAQTPAAQSSQPQQPGTQPAQNGTSTVQNQAPQGSQQKSGQQMNQGPARQQGAPQYSQQGGSRNSPQSSPQYAQNSENPQNPAPNPQNQAPRHLVIPAGTPLRVRLDQTISSSHSQAGDTFSATVEAPVVVGGETVIRRGASASGTVLQAKGLGHIKGQAVLAIRLDRISAAGRSYPVSTTSVERIERGKGRRSAEFAGGGAGLGALIGGLAGGGKGALIGALAGGGAGTAGGAMTGNRDLVLPAETMLTFRTTREVRVE